MAVDSYSMVKRILPFAAISILVLVPCFWLPRIEAGDLGSHSYNAWLTSLVEKEQAPGLWIAPQKNNVLFDILLLRLGSLLGFAVGEKVAVCIAVLLFLWGGFALMSVVAGRPAWFLLPVLIMLAYGWTFHMGFFNFYISLGLAFIALAIFWRARGRVYLYVLPLVPLIWVAHPMGLLWFVMVAGYIGASRWLNPRLYLLLMGAALSCLLALRFYLAGRYRVSWWKGRYTDLLGTGQIVLGTRYEFLSIALIVAIAGCVLLHYLDVRRQGREVFPLSAQLYVLGVLGIALLPDAVWFPWYREPISLITSRFTLGVAVLGCCALSTMRVPKLFAMLCGVLALGYFALVYRDAAETFALEKEAEALVAKLPKGSRVITTIYPFRGSRVFVHHVVDRACIGNCFNFDNYEPSSGAFRLRADPGNRIVVPSEVDANHMMIGNYVVRREDLPLWQIFQCGPREIDLCLRPLQPGPLQSTAQN
jgi:hypothetical protein